MTDKRIKASAIGLAFQKYHTPVGDLFVAARHGRIKKCFSRDTAIRYLAFFMTTEAFRRSGFEQRHPDAREVRPEGEVWVRGGVTVNYYLAHQRTVRRLRRIISSKREAQKWLAKWDAMHDRYVKEQAELQASKPTGVR
ncbi:hypothetical protein [Mangrovibacter phragmitis]|uniref:hypothetical protein n=1 Tax=Mangrovibacter phragmitis TaxID=1691903 RepID=UPI00336A2552